ncbi:AAA family ATPase [Parvularcula maris]|uniref:AAA family ATPase n=1 Tax=Parvularcula maris TaxID=2965077 RepID=A0A9X2RK47_9PROT|nr:AAA family ATPase [Parvularcula maris]MCQ8185237.1 AAA family ATPase [Parvularcula maris]
MSGGGQPALPFSPRITEPTPYCPTASQGDAAEMLPRLIRAATTPRGLTAILLRGPQGSGKSRMLEELALSEGLEFEALPAHDTPPMELFGEINRCAAASQALIIESREETGRLFSFEDVPPDLHSRLASLPELSIDRPSEEELSAALAADLMLHGQSLKPRDLAAAARQMPRNFAAVRLFCRALDRVPALGTSAQRLSWAMERAQQLLGAS